MTCHPEKPGIEAKSMSGARRTSHTALMIAMLVGPAGLSLSLHAQNSSSAGTGTPAVDPVVQRNIDEWVLAGKGVPDDWSHHHLVFSNPGTEEDAVKNGSFEQWLTTVNDPRHTMQQIKRSGGAAALEGTDASAASVLRAGPISTAPGPNGNKKQKVTLKKDWSVGMGTGTHGTAGVFPAKFGFFPNTASCSDYVVFPTSIGASGIASILAENNLYSGCPTGLGIPTRYWAVNLTVGANYRAVTTSPVLSIDGSEVAIMATINGSAYLVVLLMPNADSAGVTSIACNTTTNVNANGAQTTSPQAWCGAFGDAHADTNSSPYYDYTTNVLYVGDASGVLHKFQNVFHSIHGGGTQTTAPSEVTTTGWPVTVSTGNVLRSPVYDGTSTLVFVAANTTTGVDSGYLYSVTTTGASSQTVVQSGEIARHTGISDAPTVDSTSGKVYVFTANDSDSQSTSYCGTQNGNDACAAVWQLGTAFTAGTRGNESTMGIAAQAGQAPTMFEGSFDNTFYSGTGATGNLYVCGYAVTGTVPSQTVASLNLYQIPVSTWPNAATNIKAVTSAAATCSPMTEVYSNSTDWIFFSVTASGNLTGGTNNCSGACVYSYNVTTASATKFGNGITATGGASGITIDNTVSSPAGSSQVYYEMLSATANSAVQASQAGLQ
jgi:hypothetical protein